MVPPVSPVEPVPPVVVVSSNLLRPGGSLPHAPNVNPTTPTMSKPEASRLVSMPELNQSKALWSRRDQAKISALPGPSMAPDSSRSGRWRSPGAGRRW